MGVGSSPFVRFRVMRVDRSFTSRSQTSSTKLHEPPRGRECPNLVGICLESALCAPLAGKSNRQLYSPKGRTSALSKRIPIRNFSLSRERVGVATLTYHRNINECDETHPRSRGGSGFIGTRSRFSANRGIKFQTAFYPPGNFAECLCFMLQEARDHNLSCREEPQHA